MTVLVKLMIGLISGKLVSSLTLQNLSKIMFPTPNCIWQRSYYAN